MILIWKTVMPRKFLRRFGNKDTTLHTEGVSDVSYELWYCVEITLYQIPTEPKHLVNCNYDCVLWGFQNTVICIKSDICI